MKNFLTKNSYLLEMASLFTVLYYAFLFITRTLSLPIGSGDESLFIADLDFFIQNGYTASVNKNISILYTILGYELNLLINNISFSLRIVNILLTLIIILYFIFYFYSTKKEFIIFYLISIIFFISTASYFFSGTNDTLFFLGLILFFGEGYKYIREKKYNLYLMIFGLTISLVTRTLFIVFLPSTILFLIILFLKKFSIQKLVYVCGIPFLILIVLNLPSLLIGNGFSFEDKEPPSKEVTWTQRLYLAQLLVNEDKIPYGQHPSWEETLSYLKKNGNNSLPKSTIDSILFDYKLTLFELFKDLFSILFYGFRQIGLSIIFPFLLLLKKNKPFDISDWTIPFVSYISFFILAFIVISYPEVRHQCTFFVLLTVFFIDNIKKYSIEYFSQLFAINAMVFYGIIKHFS